MKDMCLRRAILCALLFAAAVAVNVTSDASLMAQADQHQGRSLPMFEVDHAWPKVPPQWKLGDASSIAIDAQDHVWVLAPATHAQARTGLHGCTARDCVR